MRSNAIILGAACRFASGPNLALADAALRSCLALPSRHPFYVDRGGARVRVNLLPELGSDFGAGRLSQLGGSVLGELIRSLVVEQLPPIARRQRALWLVLPSVDRPGVAPQLADEVRAGIQDSRFDPVQVRLVRGGHAAGIHALGQAARHAAESGDLCIVLAVDGWGHPKALQWLEDHRALHGAQALYEGQLRSNAYGRVPGEAAAAVALWSSDGARVPGLSRTIEWPRLRPWAVLRSSALAEECATLGSGQPCLGKGLTEAAMQACDAARLPKACVAEVVTDFNGEPYRGDELGFTTLALSDRLAPTHRRRSPAMCSGDVGAASAVLHVALAAYAMRHRQQHQHSTELVLASSDDTLRAAAVLEPITTA